MAYWRAEERNASGHESPERLQGFRDFYASLVAADPRVREAFAAIPREKYMGCGPWRVRTSSGYIETPVSDPAFLYQDILIALTDEGQINNGQPSLHALCLTALKIAEGETAIHVGAGTGYYTAILGKLVGATGSVFAYEIEEGLAERARANLADSENVKVAGQSGAEGSLPACDVLYVSAGATDPLALWLDALRPSGRLLFPLTPDHGFGAMLLITRETEERYASRFLCQAIFIPCLGARDEETGQRLAKAFRRGGWEDVKWLRRNTTPDDTSWCAGKDWWLSTAENW